jgi:hypothetical protein
MRRLFILLAFALALILPASVMAASPTVSASWVRVGTVLRLSDHGGPATTGSWRLEVKGVSGLAATRTLRVTVTTSDIAFTGLIEDLSTVAGKTRVLSHISLTGFLGNKTASVALRDQVLDLTVSSADIVLPHNGNRTLTVPFHGLAHSAHVWVRGSVRLESTAFVFGPWKMTPWAKV